MAAVKKKILLQKKKLALNAAIAPAPEPGRDAMIAVLTTETDCRHEPMPKKVPKRLPRRFSIEQTTAVLRARRFFSRPRPKTENVSLDVFSLHGYSSLRMIQDGVKACKEKVSIPCPISCNLQK